MPVFPLTGKDIMAQGIASGPQIGTILSFLEKDWLDRDFEGSKEDWLNIFRDLNSRTGANRLW